jgi:hypothetical protein
MQTERAELYFRQGSSDKVYRAVPHCRSGVKTGKNAITRTFQTSYTP